MSPRNRPNRRRNSPIRHENSLHYNDVHRSLQEPTRLMSVITSWQQGAWIALDILLVALLIYQVLVMIRGTRAAPMLAGLIVVIIIFYLARIGELTTLNWVVGHVLPYLV